MNEGGTDFAGFFSAWLWAPAFGLAVLGAHVALGYIRLASREASWRWRLQRLALACAALGSAACGSLAIGLCAQVVSYEMGFSVILLLAGTAVAVGGLLPAALLLLGPARAWRTAAAAVLVSTALLAMALLLVQALGLQPGPRWNHESLAMAGPLQLGGAGIGLWAAGAAAALPGARRRSWRWASSAAVGVAVVSAQALLLQAVDLPSQQGSLHAAQVPVAAIGLAAALGLPLLLALGLADLHGRWRTHGRR